MLSLVNAASGNQADTLWNFSYVGVIELRRCIRS